MTEGELRAIVREAVSRHLRGEKADSPQFLDRPDRVGTVPVVAHASHVLLPVPAGASVEGGACLIEPAVGCNHCGYCQSYGH